MKFIGTMNTAWVEANQWNATILFTRVTSYLLSLLTLKLLVYDWNFLGSSSDVFGYLEKSSVIFENFQ